MYPTAGYTDFKNANYRAPRGKTTGNCKFNKNEGDIDMTENPDSPILDKERRDVQPKAIDVSNWDSEHRKKSIDKVYQRAEKHALETINWYLLSKQEKKIWAQGLRFGVIILTALGGLLPIFSEMGGFSSVWASIALGFAGVLLAIDKFFGCSSAWMRFIAAEHQVRQCLHEFQMDYELEQLEWDGVQPTTEQTKKILDRCKAFLFQVDAIIRQETDQWLAEFQDALKQIDSAAKTKPETRDTGGINITLNNADQFTNGWKITVDGATSITCNGKSAALPGLATGIHKLRLEGELNHETKTIERLVTVTAGHISEESFVL